jgi:CRP/FNR family transcriptional regulator
MILNIKRAIDGLDFFKALSDENVFKLSSMSSLKYYYAEYLLYYEKTESENLLFLVEGLAKAYKIDKHDNEIFLYYIYKNQMLSEVSTLKENKLSAYANIVLVEESQILSINYKEFKREFIDKGLLCLELASEVIRQSQQLQSLVNREFIFDSVSKVSKMLYSDLEMFNQLKRYDISLMLHIQPSTLSRVLNRLKRQGVIEIHQGEVRVVDVKVLQGLYEGLAS